MKKYFYIALFGVLGVLLQQIIHAVVESWIIYLLIHDYDRFGLGVPWQMWVRVHHVLSIVLLMFGIGWGVKSGFYFWRILYVEKKYPHAGRWYRRFMKKR